MSDQITTSEYDEYSKRYFGLTFKTWNEYHIGMENWLSNIPKNPDSPKKTIKVVYATSELAFTRDVSPQNEGMPDIPLISYYLSSVNATYNRWRVPNLPGLWWETERVGDEWRRIPKAVPYDITYTVTLWHKKEFEAQYVDWNLLSRFSNNYSYIYANNASCPIFLESVSNISELEPGVARDRVLKREYSFRIEAWLPLPYTQISQLEKIGTVITDIDLNTITDEDIAKLEESLDNNPEDVSDVFKDGLRTETSPGVVIQKLENHENIYAEIFTKTKIKLGGKMKL